jgi:superfamily I DNA/RNA helicase
VNLEECERVRSSDLVPLGALFWAHQGTKLMGWTAPRSNNGRSVLISMRVALDGKERQEVGFDLREYGAVEYGYTATVHKAQGATVDRVFVLATPGMDRHLAYVGMTRHREEATLYAGNNDFKNFEALKERLSRARPKDTTLDYAQRRGLEPAAERTRGLEDREAGQQSHQTCDPIESFNEAQREFIKIAGPFD